MAFKYYQTAKGMGGGGNTFLGWSVPSQMQTTATSNHTAVVYSDSVIIIGTGNEVVTGTDSIKVSTTVTANSINSTIIN